MAAIRLNCTSSVWRCSSTLCCNHSTSSSRCASRSVSRFGAGDTRPLPLSSRLARRCWECTFLSLPKRGPSVCTIPNRSVLGDRCAPQLRTQSRDVPFHAVTLGRSCDRVAIQQVLRKRPGGGDHFERLDQRVLIAVREQQSR